jgi:hypothetical protein
MTAMPRLTAETKPGHGERTLRARQADRKIVSGSIAVESSAGQSEDAELRDISAFGCNIRVSADWLKTGKFVTLRLAKTRQVQAIVRWTRDGVAGLEFLRPIPHHEAEIIESYIGQ